MIPPHLNTELGRYESTGWLATPYRFATIACNRPSSPIVAMTRTIAAALRSARRTSAWNARDTRPPATTATSTAGTVAHSWRSLSSMKAR